MPTADRPFAEGVGGILIAFVSNLVAPVRHLAKLKLDVFAAEGDAVVTLPREHQGNPAELPVDSRDQGLLTALHLLDKGRA